MMRLYVLVRYTGTRALSREQWDQLRQALAAEPFVRSLERAATYTPDQLPLKAGDLKLNPVTPYREWLWGVVLTDERRLYPHEKQRIRDWGEQTGVVIDQEETVGQALRVFARTVAVRYGLTVGKDDGIVELAQTVIAHEVQAAAQIVSPTSTPADWQVARLDILTRAAPDSIGQRWNAYRAAHPALWGPSD
jgi:hypothetical protein